VPSVQLKASADHIIGRIDRGACLLCQDSVGACDGPSREDFRGFGHYFEF
jgi:hypothetical protein